MDAILIFQYIEKFVAVNKIPTTEVRIDQHSFTLV